MCECVPHKFFEKRAEASHTVAIETRLHLRVHLHFTGINKRSCNVRGRAGEICAILGDRSLNNDNKT